MMVAKVASAINRWSIHSSQMIKGLARPGSASGARPWRSTAAAGTGRAGEPTDLSGDVEMAHVRVERLSPENQKPLPSTKKPMPAW